ncbi:hypothetical protein QFZ77_002468 [Paenibacillus sp. V4I3]|uniref:hypothetical protein n=1 Tax=Paenibacillus sp. V4I3 TaxID=3042305 RepID=UPI00278A0749|nr:hypothetical protein [Paenibacillus sp. V4I3]MDQ0873809.1 hypothetical protein [Paenibacillus sp. V4I3]
MIGELVIATYIVECARGYYGYWKEAQRKRRALDNLGEFLKSSKTWEELLKQMQEDKLNNPVLYTRIPQTWLSKLYMRCVKE